MKFDGKQLAREIEEVVRKQILIRERMPKVVSILVGDDKASKLYTKLKQKSAERVGVEFEVVQLDEEIELNELRLKVREIGARVEVDGVMVQLPLPDRLRGRTPKLLTEIPLDKDVDGLRWRESGMMPATVRAVLSILEKIGGDKVSLWKEKMVVVGAGGVVGEPLVYFLRQRGVEILEVEWDTLKPSRTVLEGGVVISCVGKEGLVKGDWVREGVIVVDVGAPRGDMEQEVYDKASLSVEVPGGVGPVTIACLMQNIVNLK